MYIFKQVGNEVTNANRKPNSAVFPEFFKTVSRGNKKYEEKAWIGDEVKDSDTIPELKMVNGKIVWCKIKVYWRLLRLMM